MGLISTIDHAIKNVIYSIFWWFLDPLEHERLYSQLVDVIERNLDANDPERLVSPVRFDVSVNNTVFIKHAHSIKKLETAVQDRLQKYVANKDYELSQPKIKMASIRDTSLLSVLLLNSARKPPQQRKQRVRTSPQNASGFLTSKKHSKQKATLLDLTSKRAVRTTTYAV